MLTCTLNPTCELFSFDSQGKTCTTGLFKSDAAFSASDSNMKIYVKSEKAEKPCKSLDPEIFQD